MVGWATEVGTWAVGVIGADAVAVAEAAVGVGAGAGVHVAVGGGGTGVSVAVGAAGGAGVHVAVGGTSSVSAVTQPSCDDVGMGLPSVVAVSTAVRTKQVRALNFAWKRSTISAPLPDGPAACRGPTVLQPILTACCVMLGVHAVARPVEPRNPPSLQERNCSTPESNDSVNSNAPVGSAFITKVWIQTSPPAA